MEMQGKKCKTGDFSVSMAVYGGDNPAYFLEAVESLLKQTLLPGEIVLVVDGPVPKALEEIIKRYETNSLFRVIWQAVNRGHGEARRIGLAKCKFDIVAIMDADDINVEERFALEYAFLQEHKEVCIVGAQIREFDNETKETAGIRLVPLRQKEIKAYSRHRCPMNQITVMFRKKEIEAVGGYKDWYCNEDYYLWLRLLLAGYKFANLPDILVNVRVGKEMYKRRGGKKYFLSEYRLQKYMLHQGHIGAAIFVENVMIRFILQVLLVGKLRSIVFKLAARKMKYEVT